MKEGLSPSRASSSPTHRGVLSLADRTHGLTQHTRRPTLVAGSLKSPRSAAWGVVGQGNRKSGFEETGNSHDEAVPIRPLHSRCTSSACSRGTLHRQRVGHGSYPDRLYPRLSLLQGFVKSGARGGTRTRNLRLRKPLLCPIELLSRKSWSVLWESNPRYRLGKPMFFH